MTGMKVICPYTRLQPETVAALEASGYEWEPVYTGLSDLAYANLLAQLWAAAETFTLVEHDIVPWRGALARLEECPEPWCGFAYPLRDDLMTAGLGCTRFRDTLLTAHPGAIEDTLTEDSPAHPRGHWCNLDDRLTRVLTRAGAVRHVHAPPVGHLFPEPSHGCS